MHEADGSYSENVIRITDEDREQQRAAHQKRGWKEKSVDESGGFQGDSVDPSRLQRDDGLRSKVAVGDGAENTKGGKTTHEKGGWNTQQKPAASPGTSTGPLDVETATPVLAPDQYFPEGGREAWLVVLGSTLALYGSFGFMVSIGTLQEYWAENQLREYSARDIGWIPSVFVYLALSLGIWIGPLFDRYGPKYIALFGSIGYIVMAFLLAHCTLYWQFLLCCGFLGGITGATLTTTSLAVVAHWFKTRRGLAQGIAMTGSSFGGLTIPLILRNTLPKYGFPWSMRILGFLFIATLTPANFLMKARLPPAPDAKKKSIISPSIFGDMRFTLLALSVFGFEIVLFGSLGILPTYASLATNYPKDTGFYLISTMNGVSCLGRLIPGYISDKIGRFNTLLIFIFTTLIFMLALWLPLGTKSLPALYIFAALFGFGTGCWMALTPACIGQLCRAEEFGRYYGTLYFIASLATLVCVPVSGELISVVGARPLVGFFCAVLGLAMASFAASRWACLGWKWQWFVKI
ncbi:MFS general substrate transporter [Venturia nashicola]|uniref:MFS general substrate transporter n=1 Tax=Venturia nashicola TaxID=86259 RepID=A0A4Z1PHX7_9PEZI|nr:MFS general substrate transporter [Venturia nashicola]